MRPDQPKEPLQQQTYRKLAEELTERLEGQALSWESVYAAERRIGARARLFFCRRIDAMARSLGHEVDDHDSAPCVMDALTILANDSPEQEAHDATLRRRWCQARGIVVDTTGAREWVADRLEKMTERQREHSLFFRRLLP